VIGILPLSVCGEPHHLLLPCRGRALPYLAGSCDAPLIATIQGNKGASFRKDYVFG
jgi:hypothetical protein